jgi:hypothetical protein
MHTWSTQTHTACCVVLCCVVYKFLVAGLNMSSLGRRNFRLRKRREGHQLDQERMAELNSVTTLF